MSFKNFILLLAMALMSASLWTGCQKDQMESTSSLLETTPIHGLKEITFSEMESLGIVLNDAYQEGKNDGEFKLEAQENMVDFRNHQPIIDPCSEGTRIFSMDIENFTVGAKISTQSPRFQLLRPTNTQDGIVMPEYRNRFVFWETEDLNYGIENDAHTLLDLDVRTSGRYVLGFNLKVLPNSTAYFDIRRVLTTNHQDDEFAAKVWFYNNNIGIIRIASRYFQFDYPQNTWMDVHIDFDIDNNIQRFYINNELRATFPIATNPNAEEQTVQIEAVSFSTEHRQLNPSPNNYKGRFKTDNFCFARVNN